MALPGVLNRDNLLKIIQTVGQKEQIRDEAGRSRTQATHSLHRLSFHSVHAFVHLCTEPLLPALPSWPPHRSGCLQCNSSCQGCIPDPSAPAVRGDVLNLHSAFFMHLKKGSPRQAINTIAQPWGVGGRLLKEPLPATTVRELRTGSRTHLQVCLQPANRTDRVLISLQHNRAIINQSSVSSFNISLDHQFSLPHHHTKFNFFLNTAGMRRAPCNLTNMAKGTTSSSISSFYHPATILIIKATPIQIMRFHKTFRKSELQRYE